MKPFHFTFFGKLLMNVKYKRWSWIFFGGPQEIVFYGLICTFLNSELERNTTRALRPGPNVRLTLNEQKLGPA